MKGRERKREDLRGRERKREDESGILFFSNLPQAPIRRFAIFEGRREERTRYSLLATLFSLACCSSFGFKREVQVKVKVILIRDCRERRKREEEGKVRKDEKRKKKGLQTLQHGS